MNPLKTEVVYSTPFFELLAKSMNSFEEPYYSLRVPDFAVVVALTADQHLLAVRQYRPSVERYTVELPSGLVDPGETPLETARRELLEETGYVADEAEMLAPMYPELGRLTNQTWTCFARDVRKTAKPEPGIEVLTYPLNGLADAAMRGEFIHAPHLGAVLLAILQGKLRLPTS